MNLIEVGKQAPRFGFVNQDGEAVGLDDFSGSYLLMWWYPKADTPG